MRCSHTHGQGQGHGHGHGHGHRGEGGLHLLLMLVASLIGLVSVQSFHIQVQLQLQLGRRGAQPLRRQGTPLLQSAFHTAAPTNTSEFRTAFQDVLEKSISSSGVSAENMLKSAMASFAASLQSEMNKQKAALSVELLESVKGSTDLAEQRALAAEQAARDYQVAMQKLMIDSHEARLRAVAQAQREERDKLQAVFDKEKEMLVARLESLEANLVALTPVQPHNAYKPRTEQSGLSERWGNEEIVRLQATGYVATSPDTLEIATHPAYLSRAKNDVLGERWGTEELDRLTREGLTSINVEDQTHNFRDYMVRSNIERVSMRQQIDLLSKTVQSLEKDLTDTRSYTSEILVRQHSQKLQFNAQISNLTRQIDELQKLLDEAEDELYVLRKEESVEIPASFVSSEDDRSTWSDSYKSRLHNNALGVRWGPEELHRIGLVDQVNPSAADDVSNDNVIHPAYALRTQHVGSNSRWGAEEVARVAGEYPARTVHPAYAARMAISPETVENRWGTEEVQRIKTSLAA